MLTRKSTSSEVVAPEEFITSTTRVTTETVRVNELTAAQIERINLNLLYEANPIGKVVELNGKEVTVTGYREFKGELCYQCQYVDKNGKITSRAVSAEHLDVSLITADTSIATVTKVADIIANRINEGIPVSLGMESSSPRRPKAFGISGEELRAMRMAKRMTQVAVAVSLGMAPGSSAAVGDWEADRVNVPPKHQARLLELYKMEDEEELLDEAE